MILLKITLSVASINATEVSPYFVFLKEIIQGSLGITVSIYSLNFIDDPPRMAQRISTAIPPGIYPEDFQKFLQLRSNC